MAEDGTVKRFWGRDAGKDLVAFALSVGGQWVAHFGGRFDLLLLLEHLPPADEVILSGTTVLSAVYKTGIPKRLTFRDSFPWFLASLAKIGDAVGLEKLDVDRQRINDLSKQEVLDYCERDCQILMRGILAARDFLAAHGARPKWTAGSSAVELLRVLEPPTFHRLKAHQNQVDDVRGALSAVRGGRVECWARGEVEGVYSYDFKSSYPARYMREPIGIGLVKLEPGELAEAGAWRCWWRWPWRDRIPPVVDHRWQTGAGWCEAWLINEEIAALEAEGIEVTRHEGWGAETSIDFGQRFGRTLYEAKEGDGMTKFCAKVWLNSLHGKSGENPVKESWSSGEKPSDYYGNAPRLVGDYWRYSKLACDADGFCPPHVQPVAAAQILGRARVALWQVFKAIQEHGGRVLYCDTDSVHTTLPPDTMRSIYPNMGSDIGQLEIEAGPCRGIYLGPKMYLLIDDAGEIVKGACKGVPWKTLGDGVRTVPPSGIPLYRQARDKERGEDLRERFFLEALGGGAQVLTEGITSFLGGVRRKEWGAERKPRLIKPTSAGKRFSPGGAWAYETAAEAASSERGAMLAAIDPDPMTTNPYDVREMTHYDDGEPIFDWD